MCAMCSSCIAIGSGRGNRTAGEISGFATRIPDHHGVDRVGVPRSQCQGRIPCPSLQSAGRIARPTGEEETVSNATLA